MKISYFFSAMLFSAAATGLRNNTTFTPNSNDEMIIYNQFNVIDVTNQANQCQAVTGHNPKKRCVIGDDVYYMKAISFRSLGEIYNREFTQKNLGIMTPNTEIMFEKNGYAYYENGARAVANLYVSTKNLPDYEPAFSFFKSYPFTRHDNRPFFKEKMGEHNIAKFAVASSFIGDLTWLNFGKIRKKLVLVDVDDLPKNLIAILNAASDNLAENFISQEISLTLSDIKRMKKLYERMLTMPLPKVHPSVDMPQDVYIDAINIFIECCEVTINQGNQFKAQKRPDKTENMERILVNAIRKKALEYDNSFMRQVKYYFL